MLRPVRIKQRARTPVPPLLYAAPPPTCVQAPSSSIVASTAAYRYGGAEPVFDVIIANAAVTLPPAPPPMRATVQAISGFWRSSTGSTHSSRAAPENGPTTDPQDFYRIYRKRPSESVFTLHDTADKNAVQKTLTAQPPGETLQYYVRAVNVAGEGPASNTLIVIL